MPHYIRMYCFTRSQETVNIDVVYAIQYDFTLKTIKLCTFKLYKSHKSPMMLPLSGTPDKVETASVETITTENLGVEGETKVDASKRVKQSFELLHDVAAFHASAVVKNRERTNLLWAVGPNRRALCARRDLEIRRQLCKLGKVTIATFCPKTEDSIYSKLHILNPSFLHVPRY